MGSQLLGDLKQGLVHLFYPRLCEGCSKPLVAAEQILCLSCSLHLPETGYTGLEDNETTLRFSGRVPFMYATSYAYFTNDGLLQHLLHGLKYKDKKETGIYLGCLLGHSMKKNMNGMRALPIDMVMPVPLHKTKKAKRGYNQSMLIAEGIGEVLGIPATDELLIRTRNTASQTNKTRSERIDNMKDAFELKDNSKLAGKHILLCDDVLTTGATLEACALTLLKDKSVKISLATVGIAVS